eukprot:SM000121S25999  [mRNA]  locus=s121:255207:255458:+ [translate_table: standard]
MVDEPAELQAPGPDGLTSAEARRLERLRQQVEAAIPSGDPPVTPMLWTLCEEVRELIARLCAGEQRVRRLKAKVSHGVRLGRA